MKASDFLKQCCFQSETLHRPHAVPNENVINPNTVQWERICVIHPESGPTLSPIMIRDRIFSGDPKRGPM